jgi:transposase-like protein
MSSNHQEGRPSIYENSFKIMVAREYLSSKLGYGALAKKHNLPGADTARHIVKWYKKKYPSGQEPEVSTETVQEAITSSEVKELRKQLQQANLKVAAWELLLENAHKELGVDIVKKFGAKPSAK